MDSDESRPGSSASNSSDSSGSGLSSPKDETSNFRKGPKSNGSNKSESNKSGSRSSSSDSSPEGSRNSRNSEPKSPPNESKSRSVSPEDNKSIRSASPEEEENRSDRSRSSSKESNGSNSRLGNNSSDDGIRRNNNGNNRPISRNQSISPARKSKSRSQTNSPKSGTVSRNSNQSSENLKPEEISDAEIDSDKDIENVKSVDDGEKKSQEALNISHEDLSDVSDLESAPSENGNEEEEEVEEKDEEDENAEEVQDNQVITDLRQKLDEKKSQLKSMEENEATANGNVVLTDNNLHDNLLNKKHDEDVLDFEAEEGECNDEKDGLQSEEVDADKKQSDGELEDGEELEEGEVSDEDEKRPEETEPKPVCRFYTRGQCTWGMSCRFLHPGVTDKGNYTMFDMVRPVPVPHGAVAPYGSSGFHDYRSERPSLHHAPLPHHPAYIPGGPPPHARPPATEPSSESAWERGLRTAKEMMKKANKRKEQDMDFEDKKMNLSLSQDELEKDNYYARDRASPEASPPPYGRHPAVQPPYESEVFSPPHKFSRGQPVLEEDPYGRVPRYRELPPHRMPHYEDDIIPAQRRNRPAREVIVQRAELPGRGDEWNDPWMRLKSPGREKRRRDARSYTSNSSYSSTTSSRSASTTDSSRSPTPTRNRMNSNREPTRYGRSPPGRKLPKSLRSASPSPPKRRYSPVHVEEKLPPEKKHIAKKYTGSRKSPPAKRPEKRSIMSPPMNEKRLNNKVSVPSVPASKRKRPISPIIMRKNPSQSGNERNIRQRKRSSSGSGSSDSSASETDSSYSSSSESSHEKSPRKTRDKLMAERKLVKKVEMTKKKPSPLVESKSQTIPSSNSNSSSSSKKTTRREELLKQLRAVEDAIARKRVKDQK